jgi:Zn-dependent protease
MWLPKETQDFEIRVILACRSTSRHIHSRMSEKAIFDGLLTWICMIMIVTFHEFGHAWTAWKCGDDTAKDQGRISLNPLDHMDFWGTFIIPLVAISLSVFGSGLGSFLIGWGRPVPVNVSNLRNRKRDDILISMAGPAMNVVLAFGILAVARFGELAHAQQLGEFGVRLAALSMFLCFFNLMPVPPLDGSHVVKNLVGMSDETFLRLSQYGFLMIILLINLFPVVFSAMAVAAKVSINLMAKVLGFH